MLIQFETKTAVEVPQKKSVFQKICLAAGLLSGISTLSMILSEGLASISLLTGFFVPTYLMWTGLRTRTGIDYVPVQVILELQYRRIIIQYPAIRYYPNELPVSERFEYSTENIRDFQYSSELKALRFYGFPVTTIDGVQDNTCEIPLERVVYLPEKDAERICAEIEAALEIPLERME